MLHSGKIALIFVFGAVFASGAMAQGRGGGRPPEAGGPGMGSPHGTMGAPTGQNTTTPKPASLALNSRSGSAPGAKSPVTLLQQNTQLAARLASFFPQGTDLSQQAAGFKNLGQFVSAVHVSHNLGIPFDDLKCAEIGTTAASKQGLVCSSSITNPDPMSLGKAIQALRPDAKPEQAIREANEQAEKDLRDAVSDHK